MTGETTDPTPQPGRWGALLRQRCPSCLRGDVYGGMIRMNRNCGDCGLQFEREPGYFLGAMYMSYGLGLIELTPLVVVMLLLEQPFHWILVASLALLLATSPLLFRYSRLLWLYMDNHFDPR